MRTSVIALLLALSASPALSEPWAMGGIDAVSAREGRIEGGDPAHVVIWRGLTWHFATPDHRQAFEANPRAYAPGLGGNCPVAMSEGRVEPGDPRYAVVIGDRVYLPRSDDALRSLLGNARGILMGAKKVWTTQ